MFNYYKVSIEELKKQLQKKELLREEWDEYAKENGLFGSTSIMEIEAKEWKEIVKVLKETKKD
mgnify:CR=1 FL=1